MNLSTNSLIKISPFFIKTTYLSPISKRASGDRPSGVRFPLTITKCSRVDVPLAPRSTQDSSSSSSSSSSPPLITSQIRSLLAMEEDIEKGCSHVVSSFMEYFVNHGKVILSLVEAVDFYLLGTVMMVFGMGLYELFISNLDTAKLVAGERVSYRSNLFGLFTLKERPRWLEIKTVNELKTKLGHVIVMLLLIGFFEKSKTAVIQSPMDLLCFSASVLLCSGCLYLLSKLSESK
ncbi:hypothetical protein MANES_15G184400v8 [Manihot esculenta]|uniref:Uncharacterized protein n=1 Tax=Manihot esculenta TaxID=3983 RepID=A0ACB7GCQ7_MANES|nr:hypothetical protein MANES_15G184400v8 [Manihot esculenta]